MRQDDQQCLIVHLILWTSHSKIDKATTVVAPAAWQQCEEEVKVSHMCAGRCRNCNMLTLQVTSIRACYALDTLWSQLLTKQGK